MKYLKLGCYSFSIIPNELGMEKGVTKEFTRDELPDNLKILFDIIQNSENISNSKSVFISLNDEDNDLHYSGFAVQQNGRYALFTADGEIFVVSRYSNVAIMMVYNEF